MQPAGRFRGLELLEILAWIGGVAHIAVIPESRGGGGSFRQETVARQAGEQGSRPGYQIVNGGEQYSRLVMRDLFDIILPELPYHLKRPQTRPLLRRLRECDGRAGYIDGSGPSVGR